MSEIDQVRKEIKKERGDGKVMSKGKYPKVTYIPTGIFLLDFALLGGFQDGKAHLIYGVEGSGKSMVAYLALIGCQKKYPKSTVVILDLEHMYDKVWFEQLGGDPNRVEVIQPDFAEEGVDMMIAYMYAKEVSGVLVDWWVGLHRPQPQAMLMGRRTCC